MTMDRETCRLVPGFQSILLQFTINHTLDGLLSSQESYKMFSLNNDKRWPGMGI